MTVAGLGKLLEAAGLESYAIEADKWCAKMGARDLEELAENDVFEEFAKDLNFKWLEKKRLWKYLGNPLPSETTPVPSPPVSATAPAEAPVNLPKAPSLTGLPKVPSLTGAFPPLSQTVFVKNTFLDLEPQTSELPRTRTAPAPAILREESEEEAEIEEEAERDGDVEEEDVEEAASESAVQDEADESGTSGARSPLPARLYKIATYDGYDSVGDWTWLGCGGDPSSSASAGETQGDAGMAPVPEGATYEAPLDPAYGAGPVGTVMIPCESMVAPVVMPAAMPTAMCLPGCMLVPIDRFTSWPAGMLPDDGAYGLGLERQQREQALQKAFSVASRSHRIRWTVEAYRLKSKDREAASPTFDLNGIDFKMLIKPRPAEDGRGGRAFKKAQGKGTILLRVLSQVNTSVVVKFRLAIGSVTKQTEPRGPVRHDFYETPVCGLPSGRDEWDFQKAVDKTTQTFVVCLEAHVE